MSRSLNRLIAGLARLSVRSGRPKDLHRHIDRTVLGAIAAALSRRQRTGWIVTPEHLAALAPTTREQPLGATLSPTGMPIGRYIAPSTVWQILKTSGIDPHRSDVTWFLFLHSQATVDCDLSTVDTALPRRCYMLFFIHGPTRQVFHDSVTATPARSLTPES
ncbi:MAG: hypothetical protein GY925_10595 [Actinomycetia bacterium]|nr:hypothetical protein [Actinomycetes bacterium]